MKAVLALAALGLVQLALATNPIPYDRADDDWALWKNGRDEEMEEIEEEEGRHWPWWPNNRNERPNIIFMFLDDWGWNDIGIHNPEVITPNMDDLAYNGLRLDQSYVYAFCTPSRASLMTGMDANHIGRQNFVFRGTSLSGLTLERDLLPQYLHDLNYTNHIVGKWHLGHCNEAYLATSRGFDTQFGIQLSGGYNTAHLNYIDPYPYDWFEDDQILRNFTVRVGFQMDLYRDRILRLIDDQAAKGPDANPMFMYLAFQSSHFPVEAPYKYLNMYPDVDDSEKRQSFLGMTTHMDDVIGQTVDRLKETGLYDNSIIVILGDNGAYSDKWNWIPWYGGGSNLPLRGQKSNYYEGGTRVPTIVHSPLLSRWQRGRISNKMIHVPDWFPTLITAAGGDVNDYPELADLDGVDQYDAIFNPKKWWNCPRESFVYNLRQIMLFDPVNQVSFPFNMGAIRYGRWKLLNFNDVFPLQPLGTFELYDLEDDPNETTNLFGQNPTVDQKMLEKWQAAVASMGPEDPTGFIPAINELAILNPVGDLRTDFCTLDGQYTPPCGSPQA